MSSLSSSETETSDTTSSVTPSTASLDKIPFKRAGAIPYYIDEHNAIHVVIALSSLGKPCFFAGRRDGDEPITVTAYREFDEESENVFLEKQSYGKVPNEHYIGKFRGPTVHDGNDMLMFMLPILPIKRFCYLKMKFLINRDMQKDIHGHGESDMIVIRSLASLRDGETELWTRDKRFLDDIYTRYPQFEAKLRDIWNNLYKKV